MKTRIKEYHSNDWFDGKQRPYYAVQYKRWLFWRTVRRPGGLPDYFSSRRLAEKCREYIEQTGHTWVRS
mgnify:CR=1 FL=1